MENYHYLKTIDLKGKERFWEVYSEGNTLYRRYGVKDGKVIENSKTFNLKGKASVNEQMKSKINTMVKGKLRTGYVMKNQEFSEKLPQSMLGKPFEEKRITYPCFIQPKKDGIRMRLFIENGKIRNLSRTGKEFIFLDHLNEDLDMSRNVVLDGELYVEGYTLDKIKSLVKRDKNKHENVELVKYYMFDVYVPDCKKMPYKERFALLKNYANENRIIIKNKTCKNIEDIEKYHQRFVKEGNEGSIVRKIDGIYVQGRSYNIMKIKDRDDMEVTIIDVLDGTGTHEGLAVFEVKDDKDSVFKVAISETHETKKYIFDNKENYIGKQVTITYKGINEYGIPREAIVKTIRDYE